jgi:hypothetical protein
MEKNNKVPLFEKQKIIVKQHCTQGPVVQKPVNANLGLNLLNFAKNYG